MWRLSSFDGFFSISIKTLLKRVLQLLKLDHIKLWIEKRNPCQDITYYCHLLVPNVYYLSYCNLTMINFDDKKYCILIISCVIGFELFDSCEVLHFFLLLVTFSPSFNIYLSCYKNISWWWGYYYYGEFTGNIVCQSQDGKLIYRLGKAARVPK